VTYRTVFLAYWDSGFVALDLTDPRRPTLLGDTDYAPDEDGDAHTSAYDDAPGSCCSPLMRTSARTPARALNGVWGICGCTTSPTGPDSVQVGEYRTPNSLGVGAVGAGDYSIRNPLVVGQTLYASWYSDGIRVLDVSDPTSPTETAHFVPPADHNPVKPPQRSVLSQMPQMWGVYYDAERDLVLGSDMNTGLWILRVTA
jgi:hypothetical protein